jgi:propionyl-CoA carboxylase alpha chain
VRAVDPDELDPAGLDPAGLDAAGLDAAALGPTGPEPPGDHPAVAVVSAAAGRVVLDASGVRLAFDVHRIGDMSYVDSREGSMALTEVPRFPLPASEAGEGSLLAPLPGAVSRVVVVPGQRVEAGDLLMTLEAMKLEHPVHAPAAGVVASVPVSAGTQVETGAVLAVLNPCPSEAPA